MAWLKRRETEPASRGGWIQAIGIGLVIITAWIGGRLTAPGKVRTEVQTVTVVKTVPDEIGLARLRKRIAELEAIVKEKDAAIAQADAARRNAEAELALLEQELAAAKDEIQRLMAELSKPPAAVVSDANAQCPQCNHLMQVRLGLKNERIRCNNCGLIMSAKSAWARRAYVLDQITRQR